VDHEAVSVDLQQGNEDDRHWAILSIYLRLLTLYGILKIRIFQGQETLLYLYGKCEMLRASGACSRRGVVTRVFGEGLSDADVQGNQELEGIPYRRLAFKLR
jgi:hypothetical protein